MANMRQEWCVRNKHALGGDSLKHLTSHVRFKRILACSLPTAAHGRVICQNRVWYLLRVCTHMIRRVLSRAFCTWLGEHSHYNHVATAWKYCNNKSFERIQRSYACTLKRQLTSTAGALFMNPSALFTLSMSYLQDCYIIVWVKKNSDVRRHVCGAVGSAITQFSTGFKNRHVFRQKSVCMSWWADRKWLS